MGFDAVSAVKSLSEVVERRRPVATTPARTLVFTPVRSLEDLVPSLGGGGVAAGGGGAWAPRARAPGEGSGSPWASGLA